MRWLKILGAAALAALVALGALRLLHALPPLEGRDASSAIAEADSAATPLGQLAARLAAPGAPGESAIHLLNDGRSAFAARVALARAAERTLDVQYYIWAGDLSGTLLLEELRAAAARGVRVRLLLDDHGTSGLDGPLAALDALPNVEVRLFNPFVLRRPKALGFLFDFARLNRRMHNKSFTADGAATVVGGRNVGDVYFGAADTGLYIDLDALAFGPAARGVGADFDLYWNSAAAYPAARILPPPRPNGPAEVSAAADRAGRDPAARAYAEAVLASPVARALREGSLDVTLAEARVVSDDPAKALGRVPPGDLLWPALVRAVGEPRRSLRLVSAYFVPTEAGVRLFADVARGGAAVAILTNAWEAADVPLVHAGYAPRRAALLRDGVRLFELRGGPGRAPVVPPRGRGPDGSDGPGSGSGGSASGASSLHAKTFAVDGERLFVGSFNFDPRSLRLNTEMGLVLRSEALARAVEGDFDRLVARAAYEVRLAPDGRGLVWVERGPDGGETRHTTEPGTTALSRALVRFLGRLPVEWLL